MCGGLRFCVGFCLVLERYLLFMRWLVVSFLIARMQLGP
jgi:hypothetical protein